MDLRGQRFDIDLSDDEDERSSDSRLPASVAPSMTSAFIADIVERETAPPSLPKMNSGPTGFPEHKKRTRISAFRKQRGGSAKSADSQDVFASQEAMLNPSGVTQNAASFSEVERQQIDEENRQRIASMSQEEIEEEQRELLESLDPDLIQRLLRRANLDDGRGDTGIDIPVPKSRTETSAPPPESSTDKRENEKPAQLEIEGTPAPEPPGKRILASKTVTFADDDTEPTSPINLRPAADTSPLEIDLPHQTMHFPPAPSAPNLDPSDPSFLEKLHSSYFPSLPADPSKLAWMAPIPTHGSLADQESPYYPGSETLSASALRFDFRGGLLPPRISRALPMTKGLHHHGEAPEAAGYTVPELARLARSAFPAQRCMAFQTLGRLMYRLGRGEWGDPDGEITQGLWRCVEEGKVVQTLEEAAKAEGGHQGSKVYAVEALWLWQKGGGKVWKAS